MGAMGIAVSEIVGCFALLLFLVAPGVVVDGNLVRGLPLRFGVAITSTGAADEATALIPAIALMSAGTEVFVEDVLSSGKGAGAS